MKYVTPTALLCAAGFLGAMLLSPALADDAKIHEGVVVSAGAGKLIMTGKECGTEHSHKVSASAKITVNGKPGKLEDLKKGVRIKVTTDTDNEVLSITTIDDKK